jgi:hypothetical protein
MNEASRWRLALARRIAAIYAARPGVRMVPVGGSVAAGCADEYSDLDIAVYWEQVETDWLAEPPLAAIGAERFTFVPTNEQGGRLEQYFHGTLKIDVGSTPLAAWRELVEAVLDRAEIDPAKQKALSGFLGAVPLHGAAEWRLRRERIARYPQPLAEAMVRAHLFFISAEHVIEQKPRILADQMVWQTAGLGQEEPDPEPELAHGRRI